MSARQRRCLTVIVGLGLVAAVSAILHVTMPRLAAQDRPVTNLPSPEFVVREPAPSQPTPVPPPVTQLVPIADPLVPTTGPQPGGIQPRFKFDLDDKTPLSTLLPPAPKVKSADPYTEDPSSVTEVAFEDYSGQHGTLDAATQKIAYQIAKINHLNRQKNDAFMSALLEKRTDLRGLPVVMGEQCRMSGSRGQQFDAALNALRSCLQGQISISIQQAESAPVLAAENFWQRYCANCLQNDVILRNGNTDTCEDATVARISALMQVLIVESPPMQKGLVKYLASISHIEATKALARLAIFAPDGEVRAVAVDALKVRREKHYTDVLVEALRYPWPEVARRASDALVKLERADLAPRLVDMLDDADPRDPMVTTVDGKDVTVVRELVRINHHRNCMLCHAPHDPQKGIEPGSVVAQVPVPGAPLPTPDQGYQATMPDILVRADITYLRQDFSLKQPVANPGAWPSMQRFDFLIRTRTLSDEEAKAFAKVIGQRDRSHVPPNRQATLAALRRLTGRDAEPTRQAWREALGL